MYKHGKLGFIKRYCQTVNWHCTVGSNACRLSIDVRYAQMLAYPVTIK